MPEISVIMPFYNGEKTLRRCISALLAQSFCDFELILCDDGSSDESAAVCGEFSDKRITLLRLPHRGVSAARNAGIEASSGKYIAFCDCDDVPERGWLEFLHHHRVKNGLAVCGYSCIGGGRFRYGSDKLDSERVEGLFYSPATFIECIFLNSHMYQGYVWNKLFDAALIKNAKKPVRFNEKIALNEDRLFLLEYLLGARAVDYSNAACYNYFLSEGTETALDERSYSEMKAFYIMFGLLEKNGFDAAEEEAKRDAFRAACNLFSAAKGDSAEKKNLCDFIFENRRFADSFSEYPEAEQEKIELATKKAGFLAVFEMHKNFRNLEKADSDALFEDFLSAEEKFSAEPMDYFKYGFYALPDSKRAEFITRKQYAALSARLNDPAAAKYISDKALFIYEYREFLGRDAAAFSGGMNPEMEKLCSKHKKLMLKPVYGGYGKGITIIETGEIARLDEAFSGSGVAEELIEQHSETAKFHPCSVNTVRVLTVLKEGKCSVVAAAFRCGKGSAFTDNAGGIYAPLDLSTGEISSAAESPFGEVFEHHPDSGLRFAGSRLPNWAGLLEKAKEAALHEPALRLINWDFALRSDGEWELIEGNLAGGIGPLQSGGKGLAKKLAEITEENNG